MIRFKCIYCGQRILAKDDGVGKRGKCPKCDHLLTVPESTKGRPAISSDKEPMPDRSEPPLFASDKPSFDAKEQMTELLKESFGFLIPTYDKLSLFLMAFTLIFLYAANFQMREQILDWISRDWLRVWKQEFTHSGFRIESFYNYMLFILSILLVALPFQVFFKRDIDMKKKVMVFFAVSANSLTSIIAGVYTWGHIAISNWLLIFPIWNIINCVLLLLMLFLNIIDEECISDRKITFVQIVLGLVSVIIIVLICNNVFKLHWAITFSICMVYTTSFDRALQSVLPGIAYREDYISGDGIEP